MPGGGAGAGAGEATAAGAFSCLGVSVSGGAVKGAPVGHDVAWGKSWKRAQVVGAREHMGVGNGG